MTKQKSSLVRNKKGQIIGRAYDGADGAQTVIVPLRHVDMSLPPSGRARMAALKRRYRAYP